MAIIERPVGDALAFQDAPVTATSSYGYFRRPVETTGWRSWAFTVDHKKIGIMYGAVAMVFFIVGGIEASLIRLQLAQPDGTILSADKYNQMFTMHATTMVFLFVMPMAAAFANYFIPLQIGARDVAFPRLNALSLWLFVAGGLFLNTSWILGGGADGGWFMYAPNSDVPFSPSNGVDFWALGLQITGIASLVGAINLITTVLNMRAPGMSLMRMPVFTWMAMVTQFLLLFAMPVITVALFLLMFQRSYDATFFSVAEGADPLLWQHLFWIFGHPEVYIIVLPAFGIVSEVLPVFSKKPLFGYPFVVFSGAAIGFVGWGVWAHHMFASGLGPVSVAVFSVATMAIAVPTGVKIVNWTLTMWGGKLRFTTAMLFAMGLIVEFTIGGLSGVTHAVAPSDTQQTDTYYIVAHFHYVIFGGGVLGLFAGFYYWWPKIFGRALNENWGKWNFWMMIVGMNLAFGPMHIIGLQGQPRRMYVWTENRAGEGFFNLGFWNLVSTIGTFILAVGVLLFLINVWVSRKNPPAPLDPWDARTLEWLTASPPKDHNFDRIPTVHSIDEVFHRKYEDVGENGEHDYVQRATLEDLLAEEERLGEKHIHLPAPSYWPLVLAFALPIMAYGVIYTTWLILAGAAIAVAAMFGWALEPADAEPSDFDPPVDGDETSKELANV
ncbi:cytochrome c oxidase subunit I [Ilumatobacter coccineus]|uniref:cytochrome c oxidase subunit I n=1 Tax=Ilumatobacter coccineus TaxID=467094 RepID=UPI0012B69AD4|nr:cytochrome c oxidase subunit I [Ilumatobacter coccineus]